MNDEANAEQPAASPLTPQARDLPGRRGGRAVAASLALGGWSVVLLGETRYLEPLPWSAGTLGVVLVLVAAFGAGSVAGWTPWALLLFLFLPLGLLSASGSIKYDAGDYNVWQ